MLLERGARPEPRVVPRPEHVRAPKVGEVLAECARRGDQVVVVAAAVRLEPVAVVVGLEVAQELERLGGPASERGRRSRRHGFDPTSWASGTHEAGICGNPSPPCSPLSWIQGLTDPKGRTVHRKDVSAETSDQGAPAEGGAGIPRSRA